MTVTAGVLQPEGSLLSVTNTFEGNFFVNQSTSATVQVADYISQLFPNFGPRETNAAAAQYMQDWEQIFFSS
jgi:hypothetical protein